MGLELEYEDGQTPLSEKEKDGLLIKSITTHGELDEHEQLNIEKALKWIVQNSFEADRILRACLNFKFKLQTPYFDYNFTFFQSNSKGYYYEKEAKFYPKISHFRQNR